jgi:flagellar biosynthesis protein FlhB
MVAVKKLAPDISRANPFTGIKNILSWQRIVSIVRAFAAALIVSWLAVRLLLDHMPDLAHTIGSVSAAVAVADLCEGSLIAALVGLAPR